MWNGVRDLGERVAIDWGVGKLKFESLKSFGSFVGLFRS